VAAALVQAGLAVQQPTTDARQATVRRHVQALERSAAGGLDDALSRLERDDFSRGFLDRTTAADRRALVASLREAAAGAGGVTVEARNDAFIVTMSGARSWTITFTLEESPPFGIDSIAVASRAPDPVTTPDLTPDTLAAAFDRLAADGWSGVVHVRLGDRVVLERPFGQANAPLGVSVRLDTIFGTGSNPIDLTAAAVSLLAQEGRLALDDSIARYLEDVPPDKRPITLRHLLTGASGLPDFFHTAEDWNPDLGWIDRETAERRLLAAPLRFTPGTDRAHSHAAFGLLAAIVERAAGQPYRYVVRDRVLTPAGMSRTGFYGETLGLSLPDFAVGGGPERVGIPNIPPNWGPTSWLVMGSGGMFSTLPDLLRFYTFIRTGGVLDGEHAARFRGASTTRIADSSYFTLTIHRGTRRC
jgi:CubicO group peptidase (beta-lactamase class C family)